MTRFWPEPALDNAPQRIDAGDRDIRVLFTMNRPRAVLFSDFLAPEECDALIETARPHLRRSLLLDTDTGRGSLETNERTSQGTFLSRGATEVLARVESRIARVMNWPAECQEDMQILRYGKGAEYRQHFDFFPPDGRGTPLLTQRGGQRVATLLMYLNEPENGGGTYFPDVGLSVRAHRGHALLFSYETPDRGTMTLHAGEPVLSGEKWLATKWFRQDTFR